MKSRARWQRGESGVAALRRTMEAAVGIYVAAYPMTSRVLFGRHLGGRSEPAQQPLAKRSAARQNQKRPRLADGGAPPGSPMPLGAAFVACLVLGAILAFLAGGATGFVAGLTTGPRLLEQYGGMQRPAAQVSAWQPTEETQQAGDDTEQAGR